MLNPQGRHYQGDSYLRLFVRDVLKLDFSERDYLSAQVFREHPGNDRRRIDLFIQTATAQIPIEVKIHSGDQPKQCYDYFKRARNAPVFYLTLTGYAPSPESAAGLTPIYSDTETEPIGYEEVTQISFSHDIQNWLDSCLAHSETIKIAPIREILLQFKDVINHLTGRLEGGAKVEIVNAIISSPDSMKSAIDIASALPEAKIEIMLNFFRELKRLFESKERITYDYYDDDTVKQYFLSSKQIYSCLSIEIKRLPHNLMATLYIEVDGSTLYYGFAFTEISSDGKSCEYREKEWVKAEHPSLYDSFVNAVLGATVEVPKEDDSYAIWWKYICDEKGEHFDFKNFSQPCIELASNYEKQAKKIFDMLDEYIEPISEKLEGISEQKSKRMLADMKG